MKSVVMVGYAWSKNEVDWKTDSEIWIMNDMYDFVPRYDRLFDIHTEHSIINRITRREKLNHYEALKVLDKPIYMQKKWPEIPMSVEFPLKDLIAQYHIPAMGDKIFITCTVSHMLALAIYEGFEEITLLGIDEAIDDEYKDEMPSVLYWLGVAYGKGIKINVSNHSPLMKAFFVYGYEEDKKRHFIEFLDGDLARVDEIRQKAIKHQEYFFAEENKCIGAANMLEHIKKLTSEI